MKKIALLYICLTIISCNKEEDLIRFSTNQDNENIFTFSENDFTNSDSLKAEFLTTISDSLLFAGTLIANRDYLFINEIESDKYLHIIKLPQERYIGKFRNKGRGPGEVLHPWPFSISDEGLFCILDNSLKKMVEIEPDSLMKKNSFKKEFMLHSSATYDGFSIYKDKVYFLNRENRTARLFETNLDGTNLKQYGQLPRFDSDKNNKAISQIYWSDMEHKKNIFAISYRFIPLIQIFDKKKNKWIALVGPENFMPTEKNYNKRTFYNMIKVSNNYIYALYNGRKFPSKHWQEGNVIYIFNYEGKFLRKFILNKGIVNFEVIDDRIIYGLTDGDIGTKLLKFKITKSKI